MAGFITQHSIFVPVAGRQIRAAVDRTPLTQVVTQVTPCSECGGLVCDCITAEAQAAMLARIDADPHGYNDLTDMDIPL